MRLEKRPNIPARGVLIAALYLVVGVSLADPVVSFETQIEAEEIASKLEGRIVFEGWEGDGNVEFIRQASVVLSEDEFGIDVEAVFLLNLQPDADGKLAAFSTCGVGHSFGLGWLDRIYLVGESGAAINAVDGSAIDYLSEGTYRAAVDCYDELYAIHNDKNLSEIEIVNESGQTINLSWFGYAGYDYYSDTDRHFNIWESSEITVEETEPGEVPVTVEVQRISKMACDDGGPPRIIEDWKRAVTPWIPLEEQNSGVFKDENNSPATFPDYEQSELDALIVEQTGWNPEYVSCTPMDLGPTYRFKRGGIILLDLHIPVMW